MKILCIEDGSIEESCLEQLKENPEECDGKILIFRKGAIPPYVLEI